MTTLEISRYLLATVLVTAGILHFVKPKIYVKIIPDYLPAPFLLVTLSGLAEILCGLLLLFRNTETIGAYLTIVLFIAIFPANIEMARKYYLRKKKGFWLTLFRLPFQIILIWWASQFIR